MDPFSNFKITLNMSRFLNDHRSLSVLYVTERTPTIASLKDKISSIYKIETGNFALTFEEKYLPEGEDVRILENGNCIRAIPVSNNNGDVINLPAEIEEVVEENNQSIAKDKSKKKKKKNKKQDEEEKEQSDIYCNGTDPQIHKTKRKISSEEIDTDTVPEQNIVRKKKKKDVKESCSVSNGTVNIATEDMIQPPTSPKEMEMSQSNAMETSNCEMETSNYWNLANNSDITPIRKEKIEIISCVSLTPETQRISSTPNFISTSHPKDSPSSSRLFTTSLSSSNNNSRYSARKLNIDRSGVGALLEELRSKSALDDSSVTSDSFNDSQSVASVNLDDSFVNKRRKRVRTRKKKVKEVEPVLPVPEPVVFKPPNVPACPSMHIRFCDGGGAGAGDDGRVNRNQLDVTEDKEIAAKGNDRLVEGESKIEAECNSEEYIQSLPRVPAGEIEKNDVIAFKFLRMNESYSPEISSFITARVLSIMTDVDAILCQILVGIEQIASPVGKFSLPDENGESQDNNAVKCITRNDMIDLRRYPSNVKSNI